MPFDQRCREEMALLAARLQNGLHARLCEEYDNSRRKALFGLPHLPRVLEAYQERTPLAEGWEERVPLLQLFPLLVHAALFGGGYGARAADAAARYA